jgi:hypothetical protein
MSDRCRRSSNRPPEREAIRASHADRVQLRKKTVKAAIPFGVEKSWKSGPQDHSK